MLARSKSGGGSFVDRKASVAASLGAPPGTLASRASHSVGVGAAADAVALTAANEQPLGGQKPVGGAKPQPAPWRTRMKSSPVAGE